MDGHDLTPFLAALVTVMLEPYNILLARLLADKRLTRDELELLREDVKRRMEDLAPLVEAEIQRTGSSGWPLGGGRPDGRGLGLGEEEPLPLERAKK